jgi:L-iditol 2-dehydrogenase
LTPASTPAVRLTGPGALEMVELSVGEPGEGEVLLEVLAIGLCGSDRHWYREGGIGDALVGEGLVLGHEFTASVVSGPHRGQRVAVDPAIPCRACEQCLAGRPNLCTELHFAGHDIDGALRGHMVWPEWCLVPLPDGISDEQGTLLEPLGVALHAIDLAGPVEGLSVGVIGCGPIGLLLIGALGRAGAGQVVVAEPLAHRLETAASMGATEMGPGHSPDVVFETAGSDEALHHALVTARPGGKVILVGIPDGDRTSYVASIARRKELTLSVCRRMLPGDLARAAVLVERGIPGLDLLVTDRYELSQAREAFDTLVTQRGIKVVVIP